MSGLCTYSAAALGAAHRRSFGEMSAARRHCVLSSTASSAPPAAELNSRCAASCLQDMPCGSNRQYTACTVYYIHSRHEVSGCPTDLHVDFRTIDLLAACACPKPDCLCGDVTRCRAASSSIAGRHGYRFRMALYRAPTAVILYKAFGCGAARFFAAWSLAYGTEQGSNCRLEQIHIVQWRRAVPVRPAARRTARPQAEPQLEK